MVTERQPVVNVVLFTGGRGSSVLSRELIRNERIQLTLAINGYDDGLSTGEVRRLLGDSLGPSDFRKNASRLATELRTCDTQLIQLLDLRFPDGFPEDRALAMLHRAAGRSVLGLGEADEFERQLLGLLQGLAPSVAAPVASRMEALLRELERTRTGFSFADCSLGNLVFAGSFLTAGRRFNDAVDDYAGLLGLPQGLIENVTDGTNACLVAIDRNGRLLPTEASIVTAEAPQHLRDIHLLDRPVSAAEERELAAAGDAGLAAFLEGHAVHPHPNPRLLARLAAADLIVYGPGTQHSSLFPSYLTENVGATIARNLRAFKVLITNLHEDTEISGSSAVDLVNRALYYLQEKGTRQFPAPSLVTHYLINEPGRAEAAKPYVPLGHLESLEDPRLVRIGDFEDGVTGRHDAARVLTPFVEAFLRRDERLRVAVLLLETGSLNKLGQTMVEMVRAGAEALPLALTVFYDAPESFDPSFVASLPFEVRNLRAGGKAPPAPVLAVLDHAAFEYVVLFDSSGMYKGEDIVSLSSQLHAGRLDAVWGSRRLSVNDIRQAYRLVYRDRWLKGAASYLGSHVLSLLYLVLYGRYISDTLSGARAVRARFLQDAAAEFGRRDFNQALLSRLLRQRAEVFETPVYYFPISPERVRRTTVLDGLQSVFTILRFRWARRLGRSAARRETLARTASLPALGGETAPARK